jgi:hypothetical protein
MNPLQIDENTDMNYLVPMSPCDGTIISINSTNNAAQLLFYQIRKQTDNHIDKVDITGAILMDTKHLERFRDAITENLETIKNREK